MEIATIRDLLIIILYSLLTILIIGGSIAAFIIYRKVNKTVQNTVETVERPVRFVERIIAYTRGGARGVRESFSIFTGKGVNHEHKNNNHH